MHLTIKDQETHGKTHVMCIERGIGVCIVLNSDLAHVDTFATLAEALGVSTLYWLVRDSQDLEPYAEAGWKIPKGTTLLVRQLNGDKK